MWTCVPVYLWVFHKETRTVEQPAKRNEKGYRIGDFHHRARLTDHEVELFRQLVGSMPLRELALKFDISESQASKIARHIQR